MWPWEHLAFGYLLYSGYARRRWAVGPTARETAALGVAALLPDLVDKPLAWWLAVLPAGRSLAHSLLVAVPVLAVLLAIGRRTDSWRVSVAVTVGYSSHLAGDVVYPLLTKLDLRVGFLLWPIVPADPGGDSVQLLAHVSALIAEFLAFLVTPLGLMYLGAELVLLGFALYRWLRDGRPGLALLGSHADVSPTEVDHE